jgi:hypothetical protein
VKTWMCNTTDPRPHPWEPRITDVACGFMLKLTDPRCHGCIRQRSDWPGEQLAALGEQLHPNASLGDAS